MYSKDNLINKNKNKITSINSFIENKISNYDIGVKENEIDIDVDKLEKEFELKSKLPNNYPKNYGNLWTVEERKIILKKLIKNNYTNCSSLFDDQIIKEISTEIERTEQGIREEIKKMIYNDYMKGHDYCLLSKKYYIPESNIKLMIKLYIDKNGKKIFNSMENENKLLKLQIENIKLRNELKELVDKNLK